MSPSARKTIAGAWLASRLGLALVLAIAVSPRVASADGKQASPKPSLQPLENPCLKAEPSGTCAERAMDGFYRALARVERKEPGALARVSHYGDSLTADDYIASRARARMQGTFGDGGAGFLLLGERRRGSVTGASGWRASNIIHGGARGALYGLGGVSFTATDAAAQASFATAARGTIGVAASHFEVYYLEQPRGGSFEIRVDGAPTASVDTAGDRPRSAFRRVDVPDGAHRFTLRTLRGRPQIFGAVMEREGPGVVWENLGLISSSTRALARIDGGHFVGQVAHRAPDLMIVFYGANEALWIGTGADQIAAYEQNFEAVLGRLRAARPTSSCLVMSPLDAEDVVEDKPVPRPVLPKLVEAQRRAAQAKGCAFWDAYAWMGGKGAMIEWRRRGLAGSDFTHFPPRAGARIADALLDAVLAEYQAFKQR